MQVQFFYNYMNNISGLIMSTFHGTPIISVKLKTLHQSECIGGMQEEMEKILENKEVTQSAQFKALQQMKSIFDKVNHERKKFIELSKLSIIIGVITIIICLLLLPFITSFVCHNYLIGFFCSTAFAGSLSTICIMLRAILLSFKEKDYTI